MSAMLSFADWLLMVVVYLPVRFRASSDHCFRSDYGRKAAVKGHNKFVMLAAVRAHQFCFQLLRD
jgi:hypothetical protein